MNPHDITWRKSSYSDGGEGNCIEVAVGLPGIVPVRDSKTPNTPALIFTTNDWGGFVNAIKGGVL